MQKAKSTKATKAAPKSTKAKKPAQAPKAPQVVTAKLTKRNATPTTAVLVVGVPSRAKAAHNQAAYQAIAKAVPAPAAVLAALPVFAGPHAAKLVSGPAHISYLLRSGVLAVK
jgi:hypothetical protein